MAGQPATQCCCDEPCINCNGQVGSIQIEIQDFAGNFICDDCEALNATWLLDKVADEDGCCVWEACDLTPIDQGTGVGGDFCDHTFIFTRICVDEGDYIHDIQVHTWTNPDTCRGDLVASLFRNLGDTKPDCTDMEGTFNANNGLGYCDAGSGKFVVSFP
jgi:hypothetical protein